MTYRLRNGFDHRQVLIEAHSLTPGWLQKVRRGRVTSPIDCVPLQAGPSPHCSIFSNTKVTGTPCGGPSNGTIAFTFVRGPRRSGF